MPCDGGKLGCVTRRGSLADLIARTLCGLRPQWARPDDAFARDWLGDAEYALYLTMDPRDRDHARRVAVRLLRRWPQAPARLVRAAWLHDVGKSARPYRLAERVALHLWCPSEARARTFPHAWQRAWAAHRQHATRGAAQLRAIGADAELVRWVAEHHQPSDDPAVIALQRADHG